MAAFPKSGDLFEGRYRIDTLIGSGGFARVYRARQEDLGRDVALKVLTPSGSEDEQSTYSRKIAQRFVQEAKLVSKLRDAHTITMYDYGQTDDGLLYMVFEYVDGDSLVDLLDHGPLAPARVMKVVEQTLMSLQEAHALGVMHRDIKPGNIMVFDHIGRTDQVKVLDFGIAKLAGPTGDLTGTAPKDLTADGALVGTPRYMSPEQIRGEPLTAQSDLYSLGLVAYELLVGEKAIASNSSVTIIGRQLDPSSFQLPSTLDVPYGVRHVVDRLLAKDREQRYGSADEALNDVQRYNELKPPTRTALPTPILQQSDSGRLMVPGARSTVPEIEEDLPAETGSRVWIGVLVILLIAAGSLAVVASTVNPPSELPPETDVIQMPMARMLIATRPVGLEIEVNGRTVGRSPVDLDTSALHFPAIVAAKLDDEHQRKVEVTHAAPSVTIDFSDVVRERDRLAASAPAADAGVAAQAPEPRREAKNPVETKSKPEPKPKPKPKPKPEPLPTFVPMDKHE